MRNTNKYVYIFNRLQDYSQTPANIGVQKHSSCNIHTHFSHVAYQYSITFAR